MTKAAIYCRYSSENQSDFSIEDQARLLNTRAQAEGWEVVETFSDRMVSGQTMIRPGIQALLTAANERRFELVLCESTDRLSRNIEALAGVHSKLKRLGIRIVTLMEGEVGTLHVGLKGAMGEMYVQELSDRTHRGLEGRAIAGESTGGRSFGYTVTPRYDERGKRIGGIIAINPGEAAIVERIFREFAFEKKSPKRIAV